MALATQTISTRKLSNMVDQLGELNAQISALTKKADALKATLKSTKLDEIEGSRFRAVISTKTTARLSTEKVRQILTPMQVDLCTVDSTSTSISLYDL